MFAAFLVVFAMLSPLAGLVHVFGSRQACVVTQAGQPPFRFNSDSRLSDDGLFLIQHNYNPQFSEIIVYTYASKAHRYVRTQLDDTGKYAEAASPGPVNGSWTFTNIPTALRHDRGSIVFRATPTGESDYEPGQPGTDACTNK